MGRVEQLGKRRVARGALPSDRHFKRQFEQRRPEDTNMRTCLIFVIMLFLSFRFRISAALGGRG